MEAYDDYNTMWVWLYSDTLSTTASNFDHVTKLLNRPTQATQPPIHNGMGNEQ